MTFTPQYIVENLDRYIIGQEAAKRAVAIALTNRERRKKVPQPLRGDIYPRNIVMIGPTGVGKTEICRRLSQIVDTPFIKVDATKYTEIGYVGKDVESMIRDLVELEIKRLKDKKITASQAKAREEAIERVALEMIGEEEDDEEGEGVEIRANMLEEMKTLVRDGKMDDKEVSTELDSSKQPSQGGLGGGGVMPMGSFDLSNSSGAGVIGMVSASDLFSKIGGSSKRKKMMKVPEAINAIADEILLDMIDSDSITKEALKSVENNGIVFIDEIDKIAISSNSKGGEVSREGVQRDLLPLLEGTIVNTNYGMVRTDYILFITSGVFYSCKFSDLSPELQGRLPIIVKLKHITKEDMKKILLDPESSLVKQYVALMKVDKVNIVFKNSGIDAIVDYAFELNLTTDNTGARRLFSIMEKVLEDVSFNFSKYTKGNVEIDEKHVKEALKEFSDSQLSSLRKHVL